MIIQNLPKKGVKYQSVSQSVFNVNLYSKMQIESVLVCTRAKNSTASLKKIEQTASGHLRVFSNYVVCDIILHLKPKPANTLEHCTIESRFATILIILPTLNCVPICTYSLLHPLRIETSIYLIFPIPAITLTLLNIEAPFQYEV